jgi:hypothetical protein
LIGDEFKKWPEGRQTIRPRKSLKGSQGIKGLKGLKPIGAHKALKGL